MDSQPLPAKHNPYLHDLVWTLLQSHPPGRLLDIPSGAGYFARQAQEYGFEATAGEIDSSLHVFPDVAYCRMDMSGEFPLESGSYDYVVSIEGIEHIENQLLFLRECSRVLKKSGKLFLTTPNISSLESRLLFFFTGVHDNPPQPIRDDLPQIFMEHVNLIPFHRLEFFLRMAKFEIRTLTTYRMRRGSLLLYPLIYPLASWRLWAVFRKYYQGEPAAQRYCKIFESYLSKTVLCGSHIVLVAEKK